MSVAQLDARELGAFAAIAHKLDLVPYDKLSPLCGLISAGNCAAWADTYSDRIEPVDPDELEGSILAALADEQVRISTHVGPLAYNMIANNGNAFSEVFGKSITQDAPVLETIRAIERRVNDWQDGKRRELEREEENAVAYDEVGQLPMIGADEIAVRCEAQGASRAVLARFRVNESDSQTDYFGGRTTRTVVIGFGKGKRENFKQLRKAAATFLPTKHLGPGCDSYTVWVNTEKAGEDRYTPGRTMSDTFETEDDARAWIEGEITAGESQAGLFADDCGYSIECRSVENRENYSMGGGNYLGGSRYGGWSVCSELLAYVNGEYEIYDRQTSETPMQIFVPAEHPVESSGWCKWVNWN